MRMRTWCLALCGAGMAAVATAQDLQITRLQPGMEGLSLEWSQPAGPGDFVVQYKDQLGDGIWRVPSNLAPFPLSDTQWVDSQFTNSSRFYRIRRAGSVDRGRLIDVPSSESLSLFQIQVMFTLAEVALEPKYAVKIHRVFYETVTPAGEPTIASGALCLPEGAPGPLPLVSYQHGTILVTNEAPTAATLTLEMAVGVGFATRGYAAVLPDYLGLGASPGLHPYHHARSEATAGVDLLRAARAVMATNAVPMTNRVFLCGYSQGGHATMALFRELEWFHTNEFSVAACAPMAGAYDLSQTTAADFLSARPKPNPYYFLYLLGAYQDVYNLAGSLGDLLVAPYSSTLPPMLNGNTSGSDINNAMPADLTRVLQPAYLEAFRNDSRSPLRLALEDNDIYRWSPRAPLRFFHCSGDQDVLPANSLVAVDYMHSIGRGDVVLEDPQPGASHGDCARPSMLAALKWFDELR